MKAAVFGPPSTAAVEEIRVDFCLRLLFLPDRVQKPEASVIRKNARQR